MDLTTDTDVSRVVAPTGTLETKFAQSEEVWNHLATTVQAIGRVVSRARKAAKVGDASTLANCIATYEALLGQAAEVTSDTRATLELDAIRSYVQTDLFKEEVQTAARSAGLDVINFVEDEIWSYPLVLRVDPKQLGVRVGNRRHQMLRPSAIAAFLVSSRRTKRSSPKAFLALIRKAYAICSRGQFGVTVPVEEIYEVLAIRNGQGDNYELTDFGVELDQLVRSGASVEGGWRFEIFSGTTTHGGRGVRVIGPDGDESVYGAIRFDHYPNAR